jgi:ribose transport system ATP-binding protein
MYLESGRCWHEFGARHQRYQTNTRSVFTRRNSHRNVVRLSFAFQQMVEIARASAFNSLVVIFDEPTASLTLSEAQSLFKTIAELKSKLVGVVYISHKMSEVFALADRITVLRDGEMRGTLTAKETDAEEVTRLMIGRDISQPPVKKSEGKAEELFRVENLRIPDFAENVGFSVARGEILGLYGLIGAGRTEMMEGIFGVRATTDGQFFWCGERVYIGSPRDAVELGIGMVPEDRKGKGLIMTLSAIENLTLARMRRSGLFRRQDRKGEVTTYEEFRGQLDIRAASPTVPINTLSGGNQQKIALGKWLAMNPSLLILDEPTRGIDVGAKAEIHGLISRLAEAGVAIILVSSELPEILALTSRILTFNEGRLTGEFDGSTATEEMLLSAAVGTRD